MCTRVPGLICRRSFTYNALRNLSTTKYTPLALARRWESTARTDKERPPSWASDLISSYSERERLQLQEALDDLRSAKSSTENKNPVPIDQLKLVFIASATPFIGFGFLDNFIMLVAGEYIDLTLAKVFGFSTMAAAGLGNLISDLFGLGIVGYVERFGTLFGITSPSLTPAQMSLASVRRSSNFGRMVGITLGCIIGMLPILFFPSDKDNGVEAKDKETNK